MPMLGSAALLLINPFEKWGSFYESASFCEEDLQQM